MLATTGRRAALEDLRGPGLETLRHADRPSRCRSPALCRDRDVHAADGDADLGPAHVPDRPRAAVGSRRGGPPGVPARPAATPAIRRTAGGALVSSWSAPWSAPRRSPVRAPGRARRSSGSAGGRPGPLDAGRREPPTPPPSTAARLPDRPRPAIEAARTPRGVPPPPPPEGGAHAFVDLPGRRRHPGRLRPVPPGALRPPARRRARRRRGTRARGVRPVSRGDRAAVRPRRRDRRAADARPRALPARPLRATAGHRSWSPGRPRSRTRRSPGTSSARPAACAVVAGRRAAGLRHRHGVAGRRHAAGAPDRPRRRRDSCGRSSCTSWATSSASAHVDDAEPAACTPRRSREVPDFAAGRPDRAGRASAAGRASRSSDGGPGQCRRVMRE